MTGSATKKFPSGQVSGVHKGRALGLARSTWETIFLPMPAEDRALATHNTFAPAAAELLPRPSPPECSICVSAMVNPSVGGAWYALSTATKLGRSQHTRSRPRPDSNLLMRVGSPRSCHHFCFDCYEEWARQKATCPTCRAPVWNLKLDVEYADLCGAEITPKARASAGDALEVAELAPGIRHAVKVCWPAGLTLTNSPKGNGVLVVKVVRGNGAHRSGIRAGHLILAVNGTMVRDHTTAVEFIEQRCRVGDCMVDVQTNTAEVMLRQPTVLFRRLSSRYGPRRTSPVSLDNSSEEEGEESATPSGSA